MSSRAFSPLLPPRLANRLLTAACIGCFCIIIYAGFKPFTARQPNEVQWVSKGHGLHFGEFASIMSDRPLAITGHQTGDCSVELWMQPGVISDSNTMLAFYIPDHELQFSLRQVGDGIIVQRAPGRSSDRTSRKQIYLHNVLFQDVPVLITITADSKRTAVYLNGALKQESADFGLSQADLNGRIVVGNSPFANDSWSGILYGLGIYGRAMNAEEVATSSEEWKRLGQPDVSELSAALALYDFSVHTNGAVKNRVAGEPVMTIPPHYFIIDPPFLEAFWRPGFTWGDWEDGLENLFGFVVLGVVLSPFLGRYLTPRYAILVTIVVGVLLSFSIEATQYYLPTRDSDSRDLLSNSLGTILGVLIYAPKVVRDVLKRCGVHLCEPEGTPREAGSQENTELDTLDIVADPRS